MIAPMIRLAVPLAFAAIALTACGSSSDTSIPEHPSKSQLVQMQEVVSKAVTTAAAKCNKDGADDIAKCVKDATGIDATAGN